MTTSIKKGILSWKAVPGTDEYLVWIIDGSDGSSGNGVYTKSTSLNINQTIDKMIKENNLFKTRSYVIALSALDSDAVELATKEFRYTYNSSAVPDELGKTITASITDDELTFTKLPGDYGYNLRVVANNLDYMFPEDADALEYSTVDLRTIVDEMIEYYDLFECPVYKIELLAYDDEGNLVAKWTGSYKYKDSNTLSVKGKTAKVKYRKVRRKTQKLSVSKVIKLTNKGQGRKTYKKISGNKKITVSSSGKVTVKKKIKRKTYKVKIRVRAAGDATHAPVEKTVTVKIKVK